MVPYVGDLAKLGKLKRLGEVLEKVSDLVRASPEAAVALRKPLQDLRNLLDGAPLDKLPGAVREQVQALKSKLDEALDAVDWAKPDGPAYRVDSPTHLSGPDGFKAGRLHGTHNQHNAIAELQSRGGTHALTPTETPGINELNYRVVNPNTGKVVKGAKTVYDGAVYSDRHILALAQQAGKRAFEAYKAHPAQNSFDVSVGGVDFRAYINTDKTTGAPYVGNVHPIR